METTTAMGEEYMQVCIRALTARPLSGYMSSEPQIRNISKLKENSITVLSPLMSRAYTDAKEDNLDKLSADPFPQPLRSKPLWNDLTCENRKIDYSHCLGNLLC